MKIEETVGEFEPRMASSVTHINLQQAICFLLASEQVLLGSTSLSFVSRHSIVSQTFFFFFFFETQLHQRTSGHTRHSRLMQLVKENDTYLL